MSTSPLPAVAPPSPVAVSQAPRSSSDQGDDDGAFDTHLQSAHQQQSSDASNASSTAAQTTSAAAQDTSGQSTSAQSRSGKSSNTTANGADSQSDAADAADTSLASAVLGLIDQSAGDATASDAANSSGSSDADGKVASAKTSTPAKAISVLSLPPTQQATQLVTTSMPTTIAPAAPPTLPSAATAVAPTSGKGGKSGGALQVSGTTSTTDTSAANATSALTAGKTTGAFAASDDADNASDTDSGDDSGDSDGVDVSALVQGASNNMQTMVNSLLTHAAPTSAESTPTSANPSTDATNLGALRGVLNASTLITPTPTSDAPHSLAVSTPVTSPGFAQELGQQVAWLGGQEVKQAQIRLNPQDLGQLDVKVSVDRGRVDVSFIAQHPAAATAVQQSLGQLNQMLSGQGLSLGQATVGQQHAQQQFHGSAAQQSSGTSAIDGVEDAVESVGGVVLQGVGLVDAFA